MKSVIIHEESPALSRVNETLGTPNGSTTVFSGTLSKLCPVGRTFSVYYTQSTNARVATDDGNGNIVGNGITSGTINYVTGAYSITFSTAPDNSTTLTGNYMYVLAAPIQVTSETQTGITSVASYSPTIVHQGFLLATNLVKGSLTLVRNWSSSPVTITDNGRGELTGSNVISGHVDYSSGFVSLTLSSAPDSGSFVATYKHDSKIYNNNIKSSYDNFSSLTVENINSDNSFFILMSSPDNEVWTKVDSHLIPSLARKTILLSPILNYSVVTYRGVNLKFELY